MQNNNLVDRFMSAEEYNRLPHIDDMRDAPECHASALQVLLGLISQHGLRDKFSVHLLHKHFDAPNGSVMVYQTKSAPQHPTFMVFGPRIPAQSHRFRGLYYQAQPGGKMRAYEYTSDVSGDDDMSKYGQFVGAFSDMCFELGVHEVFALSARRHSDMVYTEIEWAEYSSTILFPESLWPFNSKADERISTITDWSPPSDPTVPGIIELKCSQTRSNKHYNFTCSSTRSGKHYQKRNQGNGSYELDGVEIVRGTDMFSVFDAAQEMLAVY